MKQHLAAALPRIVVVSAGLLVGGASAQTEVFSTDFESGIPDAFSGIGFLDGVQGFADYGFSGSFLRWNGTVEPLVTLTLTDLPTHDTISLSFLLAAVDSLDGVGCAGTSDHLEIAIDGIVIFNSVFENSMCGTQTYDPPEGVTLVRHEHLGFGGGFHFTDSAYDCGLDPTFANIPHSSSTATITFRPHGHWQGGADESYAIDNISVVVDGDGVACAEDLSGDGLVDTVDLLALLGDWGGCKGCDSDLNADGMVDTIDLLQLLGAWGSCS